MSKYTIDGTRDLASKIRDKSDKVDSYLASTVNKAATFARNRATDVIAGRVTLQPSYIKQRLQVRKRASPKDPTAIIRGNERATLLTRYQYTVGKDSVSVKVNRKGGYENIKRAFKVTNLRGSYATGIAMINEVAYEYYKGLPLDTPGKKAKLAKLAKKAKDKPRGIYVLHSRSIDQLFTSAKEDISGELLDFMAEDFLKRLNS